MQSFFTWVMLLFGVSLCSAQYTVGGTVQDDHNRAAIFGAEVSLGKHRTVTQKDGKFSFENVKPGTYQLTVKAPDAEVYTETIVVDRNLHLSVSVEEKSHIIEAVNLHGTMKKSGSIVIKTLDKQELERNRTENLGNVLSNVSGVSALKTGNNISKPIIHGLYGSRVSILTDGVKMAEQEWGVEHAPNVDVSNFDHIDVVKGASALRYGSDAVGGVVMMEPSVLPKKDTLMGRLSLSGISNGRGANFNANIIKSWKSGWAVKTNGSFEKLGDLQAPHYGLMNTGLQNSSFSFGIQNQNYDRGISADYYLTNQSIGILRSSHISSSEDLYEALTSQQPIFTRKFSYLVDNPKQEIEHHIVKLAGYKRFGDFGKLSATYSFQFNHRQEFDIRRDEKLSQIPELDMELITSQLNINHQLEREKWSLESGIDGTYQNNWSNPKTEARRLIPNYDKYSGGIYSIFKYKINADFNAEAGARFDYNYYDVQKWYNLNAWEELYADKYPQFVVRTNMNRILTNPKLRYSNFSGNVGFEYHPSGLFNLKLNYARVTRTPNIAELFADGLHHSAAILEHGDMTIKNETGNQLNLIADTKFNVLNGLTLSVNPYFFYTKNFINQVPSGYQNTQWGNFVVWQYQQINAKMYGVDADLSLKITPELTFTSRGSCVYGQDLTHDVPLILMPPANFYNGVEFSKPAWNHFFVNIINQTVLKQKRFPVYNVNILLYDAAGVPYEKEVDISTPPAGYSLWNAQAGVDIFRNLSASLSVKNIFNTAYRDYLNRLRYFSDDAGRNFIFTLNYKF